MGGELFKLFLCLLLLAWHTWFPVPYRCLAKICRLLYIEWFCTWKFVLVWEMCVFNFLIYGWSFASFTSVCMPHGSLAVSIEILWYWYMQNNVKRNIHAACISWNISLGRRDNLLRVLFVSEWFYCWLHNFTSLLLQGKLKLSIFLQSVRCVPT